MAATITVSIWHNVTRDAHGRRIGFDGFRPGDQMVKVFTYQTDPDGRSVEEIAEDAFAMFNDAPRGEGGHALACRYRQRRLRSLSFPGKSLCCPRSCCPHPSAVWPWIDLETEVQAEAVSRYEQLRNGSAGQETRR
jgi:hypothetical protein